MYDKHGAYVRQYPIVNLTLRTGFFDVDDNIEFMTHGSYIQATAATDYIVDPDVSAVTPDLVILQANWYIPLVDYIIYLYIL